MHARQALAAVSLICLALSLASSAAKAQGVIYVDDDAPLGGDGASWPTAYKYLQDALHAAVAGDEIRVAGGTYRPDQDEAGIVTPGDREASFELISDVAIMGGYAGLANPTDPNLRDIEASETILRGDLNGDDAPVACSDDSGCKSHGWLCLDGFCIIDQNNDENSYHVVSGSGTDVTTLVDGLSITAGNADGEYPDPTSLGGGMYNYGGGPTLTNCTFSGNSAENGGGMNNSDGSPTLTSCMFTSNHASWAGALSDGGSGTLTLVNCTFSGNTSDYWGGAMDSYTRTGPTLSHCTFTGNSAGQSGGALNNSSGSSTLINCRFLGNSSGGGGGAIVHQGGTPSIKNCLFSGNSAHAGGAVYSRVLCDLILANCTFVGNSATRRGGAVYNSYSTAAIANCVMSGNLAPDGPEIAMGNPGYPSTVSVAHSDVEGGQLAVHVEEGSTLHWGKGNIDAPPSFVDADGLDNIFGTQDDDLRLMAESPAIDAGDNEAVPEDVLTDLDGNTRFVDDPDTPDTGSGAPPIVDMGAYEYQATCGDGAVDSGEECDGTNDESCPAHCISPGNLRACRCEPTGACCDGFDASCEDRFYVDECLGEQLTWHGDQECDSLQPPCERHTGACCDASPKAGGTCTDGVFPEDCIGSHREWFKGVPCAHIRCYEGTGACCDRTPLVGGCTDDVLAEECICDICDWFKETACEEIECVKSPIPTVSEWGLVVMALLLLTGGKIAFGHRRVRRRVGCILMHHSH